jgi:cytochrome b involved in lipid metabolism
LKALKAEDVKKKFENARQITMEEVSRHNSREDAWAIIKDRVFNITNFAKAFPDSEPFLEAAGKDATALYGKKIKL